MKINTKNYHLLTHSLFWLLVIVFYTLFFGHQAQNYFQTFLFAGLLMPTTIGTSYFLMYFLIPRYLLTKKYAHFILFFSYCLITSVWLELLTIVWAFIWLAEYKINNMNPATLDISFLLAGTYVVVFGSVSIYLFKKWNDIAQDKLKTELRLKEAELYLLKAQIHPHFLFNTLNTLYGFALEKSDLTPKLVLQLSALLDYALYHSNQEWVSLHKEIQYLQDFIALEKLRYEDDVPIELEIKGNPSGLEIAPMLLLPFVENSFKHGLHKELGKGYILIEMEIVHHTLSLKVENSISTLIVPFASTTSGGLGLENVQKRLEWLYPKAHQLEIKKSKDKFEVFLEIHLSKTRKNEN